MLWFAGLCVPVLRRTGAGAKTGKELGLVHARGPCNGELCCILLGDPFKKETRPPGRQCACSCVPEEVCEEIPSIRSVQVDAG